MKSGEIGCVVVKDFSRFGRDYLEVGFYIEYIFPLLQIRFISINDSYDSAASNGMTDLYKQRAEKISGQLDEIKRKIEDAENSKKLLEQNELSDKIKLKDFLGIQKFDTEKLREIIKVIRVHSQDEIEIEWNFDDIFSEQR